MSHAVAIPVMVAALFMTGLLAVYSVFYNEKRAWYAWVIMAWAIYPLGFLVMSNQTSLGPSADQENLTWREALFFGLIYIFEDLGKQEPA